MLVTDIVEKNSRSRRKKNVARNTRARWTIRRKSNYTSVFKFEGGLQLHQTVSQKRRFQIKKKKERKNGKRVLRSPSITTRIWSSMIKVLRTDRHKRNPDQWSWYVCYYDTEREKKNGEGEEKRGEKEHRRFEKRLRYWLNEK